MSLDPDKHHRRSIRLADYDYTNDGAYFVTICTQNRECLFGKPEGDVIRLNDAGWAVKAVWDELPVFYPGVDIDAFIVMPNHVHGIIIVGADPRACPDGDGRRIGSGQPQGGAPTLSLADVVHRFKTMTTKQYSDGVKRFGWPPFDGRVWQRNYYEHIIRDENSLDRIRVYIEDNPFHWEQDRENPKRARQAAPLRVAPWYVLPGMVAIFYLSFKLSS